MAPKVEQTLNDLLVLVKNRKGLIDSKMGELRRTIIDDAKPIPKNKQVIISGKSFGTGAVYTSKTLVKSAIYPLIMSFFDVSFKDKPDKKHSVKVHLGHGNFIYQEPLRKSRHPVQVRCKCFTGDTLIQLVDGTSVPIKDLVGKNEFFVYSFDYKCNKKVIGRGHSARKTGKKQKIVKVTFDNGESIRCTPDHKFLLANGLYKEVKNILPNELLMTLYRKLSDKIKNHKIIKIEDAGYEDVYCLTVDKYHNFSIDVDNGKNVSSGVFVKNCKDYFFTFWFWNKKDHANAGRPFPKYVRKTTTYPERNVAHESGFCKHLFSLMLKLEKEGLLKR